MAYKLSEQQEDEVVMKLAEGLSYSALAKEYGVTPPTIANIKKRHPEILQIFTQKKEENIKSFLDHMDSKKKEACFAFDKLLTALSDDVKVEKATLGQVATALGVLIDKFTAREQPTPDSTAANNLLEALTGEVKGEAFDEISELQ